MHSISMEEVELEEEELEGFQKEVTERFANLCLSDSDDDELLSLAWLRKLLYAFLSCQENFRLILFKHTSMLSKPPMDRLLSDYFDRTVKALDLCNAIRDGIQHIRQCINLVHIVLCALNPNLNLCEAHFRRAKKALIDLSIAIAMLDDHKESQSQSNANASRNRSFGRNNFAAASSSSSSRSLGHFRSLSWSVSRSWSASRQLQAIGNNLVMPKGNGLAVPVFTMNWVLLLAMWTLVAAIPCQDRGLQVHFYIPRQFVWAGPVLALHERIMEESKKRERRNACGLLKEILHIEKTSRQLSELVDSLHFPLTEEKEAEVRNRVQELSQVYQAIKEGLDPLERQLREVFHRILRSSSRTTTTLAN
ncbi:hypothetical protein CMV_002088 [Castanea mollissima]|uniref:Uncharacterized protein n=1 Tax=Castanea mollissima TaxID=60419 RepID=A0A8J4RWP5_9ROSI|nr:hypothetical protein CMV_002088 [Castanea mollissima]